MSQTHSLPHSFTNILLFRPYIRGLWIWTLFRSGYKTATFKTATVKKQRHHKTATVTKQRQLQNSDCYKTATTTKQQLNCYKTPTTAKKN